MRLILRPLFYTIYILLTVHNIKMVLEIHFKEETKVLINNDLLQRKHNQTTQPSPTPLPPYIYNKV